MKYVIYSQGDLFLARHEDNHWYRTSDYNQAYQMSWRAANNTLLHVIPLTEQHLWAVCPAVSDAVLDEELAYEDLRDTLTQQKALAAKLEAYKTATIKRLSEADRTEQDLLHYVERHGSRINPQAICEQLAAVRAYRRQAKEDLRCLNVLLSSSLHRCLVADSEALLAVRKATAATPQTAV